MIRLNCINDTKMIKLNQKEKRIINIFLQNKEMQSSDVHGKMIELGEEISLVTIKRILPKMVEKRMLVVKGGGRSTVYRLSANGRIFAEVNAQEYLSVEPDKRYGLHGYNFDLFSSFPPEVLLKEEIEKLDKATREYKEKTKDISPVIAKKELERLVIELSWKSSKIEGNTYTLLDTEKLILENKPAEGKTKQETQMILNHKDAFNEAIQNKEKFKKLNYSDIEYIHSVLIKKLDISKNIRNGAIGITGTKYKPLDNSFQIKEVLQSMVDLINKKESFFEKAFLVLILISYIQVFEDGNKRTARMFSNAILLAYNSIPLSYRIVDIEEYKKAILLFYEINNIAYIKQIFIDQFEDAVNNYFN